MILNFKDDITLGIAGVANSGVDIIGIQNKRFYHGHKLKNKIKARYKIIHLWKKKYNDIVISSSRNKCIKQLYSLNETQNEF